MNQTGFSNNNSAHRTDSIGSIVSGRQQTLTNRSEANTKPTLTSPVSTAASALGTGGPSDWEHLGSSEDEVDDTEMFGVSHDQGDSKSSEADRVELPSQPSPPSAPTDWPSPPAVLPLNIVPKSSGYAPTPPPAALGNAPQVQQGSHFVMDDMAPTPTAPRPTYSSHTSFDASDGGVRLPGDSTPTAKTRSPPANSLFVGDDGATSAAQSAFAQRLAAQTDTHAAELAAKDDALAKLAAAAEREKSDLRAHLERANTDKQAMAASHETETQGLKQQSDLLRAEAEQNKKEIDAKNKAIQEMEGQIAKLKSDVDAKDRHIAEKDDAAQKLREELQTTKQGPLKPGDLIAGLDPWYAGSLERYIAMLRTEAGAPDVEDKIKAFTGFLAEESRFRGLEYYSSRPAPAGPAAPIAPSPAADEPKQGANLVLLKKAAASEPEPPQFSPGGRPIFERGPTLPAEPSPERRINEQKDTTTPLATATEPQAGAPARAYKPYRASIIGGGSEGSVHSAPVLTPTSSATGDDVGKTTQSPPPQLSTAPPPQSQYKPYLPSGSSHRQSLSFASTPPCSNPAPTKPDEIFFGEPVRERSDSKSPSRPTSTAAADATVPAPFGLASTPTFKTPLRALADLLPQQIDPPPPNARLQAMLKQAAALPQDFSYIASIYKSFEESVARTRRANDDARHKRQEENEAHTDELFHNNEISYADIGEIEDEFKEKERQTKVNEDAAEYSQFVREVFGKIYDSLQADIKLLVELFIEADELLRSSVSGKESLESSVDSDGQPTTVEVVAVLKEFNALIELRQAQVAQAVEERDRRYKRKEIQPLYARGQIQKMKSLERHFANAERQAALRTRTERADRLAGVVKATEDGVVLAVAANQDLSSRVVAAMRALPRASATPSPSATPTPDLDNETGVSRDAMLILAKHTLEHTAAASRALLGDFLVLELDLSAATFDAELAQLRLDKPADGSTPVADPAAQRLEADRADAAARLRAEHARKLASLDEAARVAEGLMLDKGGARRRSRASVALGGEMLFRGRKSTPDAAPDADAAADESDADKEARLRRALEEAKRRNADV